MWVAEERKEEYLAAGHTVANCENPIVEAVEEKPAEEKPKRGRKKSEVAL